MKLRWTDPIPTRRHEGKPQRGLRVALRRIRDKPPAEVGKSSGPVSSAAAQAQEPRHPPEDARCLRGQQNQKQNAAPRTQGQKAPIELAPTIENVWEQLRD